MYFILILGQNNCLSKIFFYSYNLNLDVALGSQQEDKVANNWEKAYDFGVLKNDEEFEIFEKARSPYLFFECPTKCTIADWLQYHFCGYV